MGSAMLRVSIVWGWFRVCMVWVWFGYGLECV